MSASFLALGVLECNLAHRRPVALFCILFLILSNPMHSLSGALPLQFVRVRVMLWTLCFPKLSAECTAWVIRHLLPVPTLKLSVRLTKLEACREVYLLVIRLTFQ